jgi:serine/threonine-protein kinase
MTAANDWVGREIAGGRYSVRERIGIGSMGQVYRAFDYHLENEVVIKSPMPPDGDHPAPSFLRRFELEIRSLVRLSNPHIVKVIDVGVEAGLPYVVMQYLSGGSLKDRLETGPRGEPRPQPPVSLRDWLMDVAKALDFVHARNYLHRDVKPDNILFDHFGNAFLTDFGIIKALAADERDRRSSAMTAPGLLLGTPAYVAPEVVLGRPADARSDQYSLAMTVHEILSGSNPMEGATPSATLVNQTKSTPRALVDLIPGIPRRLSDAVLRGLSKAPEDRFDSCVALAQEILEEVPDESAAGAATRSFLGVVSRGAPGRVACPVCKRILPVQRDLAGKGIQCTRCRATHRVESPKSTTIELHVVSQPSAPWTQAVDGPRARRLNRPLAAGLAALACALGAALAGWGLWDRPPMGPDAGRKAAAATPALPAPAAPSVSINIAYSAEKKAWLESAVAQFARTEAGMPIEIRLHEYDLAEGASAVLDGPGSGPSDGPPIHVWSPASRAAGDLLDREWRSRHGDSPILAAENLAATPLVFVMWKARMDAFQTKYETITFGAISQAMSEPEGWQGIARKPEWGRFKFGHADPSTSSSGLQMLILIAAEFSRGGRELTAQDVTDPGFRERLGAFEQGVTRHGRALCPSAGELIEQMVLRGPSQYDCILVDENLALGALQAAADRWGDQGELAVAYPDPDIRNEHPYYILNVPWSDEGQRRAAAAFLRFLKSLPIQRGAVDLGIRPDVPAARLDSPGSPLVRAEHSGLRVIIPASCDPPAPELVQELLESFRRIER